MLSNSNIKLRAVEPNDVDFLFKMENEADNWSVSGTLIPFSRKSLTDYANSFHDITIQKQFRFVIVQNEIRVGLIDLFDYDAINARAGVGIIVDKTYQNLGIGSSSLMELIKYAKNILGLKQLHCSIHEDNRNSIRLFLNAGFTNCGNRKDWYYINSQWKNEELFQLIFKK